MIQQNISLKSFNTFGIDAYAKYFASFSDADELTELITQNPDLKTFVLGGGSNILFTKNFDGLILKNEIKGIDLVKEDADHLYIQVGAGENWHQFVTFCINRNWAGVENLSLIPGNVGASPMQNIGAYGVEIKEVFYELEAFNLAEKKVYTFSVNDCKFGYRDSIFKNKYKDQFVILSVTYCLNKFPTLNLSYGALEQELERMNITEPNLRSVSQAVINIRSSKLPDPNVIGNAGSFFKNPLVTRSKFEELKINFPNIVGFTNDNGNAKLSAGWLIEQCGWKGFRKGDAGCYSKQALVLVNYGNASGKEIYDLSEEIFQSVKNKFGVELEREVNII
ncbi:MAG TPA: UDP-N-acetylmuramate dehydrogenase [Puia sp.]|jgi:UDP-N-acetylmuramate dehydrogenase|nr:UDP-N-acetylmuramate dehydrogenase [Puia sp.]